MADGLGKFAKAIKGQAKRYKAIRLTHAAIAKTGRGEVIVSRRKKEPWEKSRAPHGRVIVAQMRKDGKDPFEYPEKIKDTVNSRIKKSVRDNIRKASKTRKKIPNSNIQRVIKLGSFELANWAKTNIVMGKLGTNSRQLAGVKKRLVFMDRATLQYGNPPPYGIRTGRFLNGIRHRFRKGRRPANGKR